jgi:hypothetical protein
VSIEPTVDRVPDEEVERARVVPGDVVEDALCDRRVQIVGEATMPNPLTVTKVDAH